MSSRTAMELVAAVGLLVAGCGGGGPNANESRAEMVGYLHGRSELADYHLPYSHLSELLGNVRFEAGDAAPEPLTEAVVVGSIDNVSKGRGFEVPDESRFPNGLETDFDDLDVLWKTVHLRVEVSEVVSGVIPGDTIEVGIAFAGEHSYSAIRSGLLDLDSVLLFLNRSPVFAYDPDVFGTVQDGFLLGEVSESGAISLPVLDADQSAELLEGSATIAELKEAAVLPPRVVRVDATGSGV